MRFSELATVKSGRGGALKTRFTSFAMVGVAMAVTFSAGYYVRAGSEGYYGDERNPMKDLVRTADIKMAAVAGTPRAYKPDLKPYETLDEVRRAIKSTFVRTQVSDQELTYGAIRGMLHSLGDRFTRFLTPADYAKFNEQTDAEFVGIGARIDMKDEYIGSSASKPLGVDRPYIVEVIDGSPALKAGLKKDDVILSIDGHSTAGMGPDAAVAYIRGARGSKVTLRVERNVAPSGTSQRDAQRDSAYKTLDLPITRDTIEVHPVTLTWLPNRVAWLRLDEFNNKTEDEMARAIKQIKTGTNGEGAAKGLVFDLRDNPGGLVTAAVDVCSHFVPSGPVLFTRERTGAERAYNAETKLFANLKMPIVVLVNNYSASAAEIVTGALKDKSGATVVGEPTFGKALVQEVVELRNGGALVITTARYLTPAKRDISDKGIVPDVIVKATPGDDKDGRGAQLQRAVAILEGRDTPATPPASSPKTVAVTPLGGALPATP